MDKYGGILNVVGEETRNFYELLRESIGECYRIDVPREATRALWGKENFLSREELFLSAIILQNISRYCAGWRRPRRAKILRNGRSFVNFRDGEGRLIYRKLAISTGIRLFVSERRDFPLVDVYSRHATIITLRVPSAHFALSPVSQELEENVRGKVARECNGDRT